MAISDVRQGERKQRVTPLLVLWYLPPVVALLLAAVAAHQGNWFAAVLLAAMPLLAPQLSFCCCVVEQPDGPPLVVRRLTIDCHRTRGASRLSPVAERHIGAVVGRSFERSSVWRVPTMDLFGSKGGRSDCHARFGRDRPQLPSVSQ